MTEPSEKEVEAVARAIFDGAVGLDHWDNEWYREERDGCFLTARDAIAAYEKAKADEYMRNTMS